MSLATDNRPRVAYVLPDGTEVRIIHDHYDRIMGEVSFQLKTGEVVLAKLADKSLLYTFAGAY